MIDANSRYAQSTVTAIKDPNTGTDRATIVAGQQDPFAFNYNTYQVRAFERIDNLAFQFYGDQTAWWKIADANPEILDWSILPAGTVIRVPFL